MRDFKRVRRASASSACATGSSAASAASLLRSFSNVLSDFGLAMPDPIL